MKQPVGRAFPVAATLVLVAVQASSQSRCPETDTQNWNDVYFAVPMNKRVDFVLQGTLRIGDNITTPVDERWGVGWIIKINKYLSFTPNYFHREAQPPHGRQEREDRITLGAIFQKPIGKFTLSDRNWFEH